MQFDRVKIVSLVVSFLLIFLLATAGAAPKEKVWVTTELPMPDGADWYGSFGNDVNDSGYIGGGWIDEYGTPHAGYWYGGAFHDLEDEIGVPAGQVGGMSNVLSINNHGLMGGVAAGAQGQVAMLWDVQDGEFYDMDPGGDYVASSIWGVNAGGDAAGWAARLITLPDDTVVGFQKPYVWPKNGDGFELPVGLYANGWANGVNSSGVVAGAHFPADAYNPTAVIWKKDGHGDYEMVDVHALLDDNALVYSEAFDVHENGRVVGFAVGFDEDGDIFAYAWAWRANSGVSILDDDGEGAAIAYKAAGNYIAGSIGWGPTQASVWVRGELEVIPELEGLVSAEASSANRSGLVVGYGFDEDGVGPWGWYAEKK